MPWTRRRAPRSLCGLFDCSTCEKAMSGDCPTCVAGNRELVAGGGQPCDVYVCVKERRVASCRECAVADCPILEGHRDNLCPLRDDARTAKRRRTVVEALRFWRPEDATRALPSGKAAERIGQYLWVLQRLGDDGVDALTSGELARYAGVRAALVRRDLSRIGQLGTRSAGYQVQHLLEALRRGLGLAEPRPAVWLGAAALERMPDAINLFARHKCSVVAIFDEGERVGGKVLHLRVRALSSVPGVVESLRSPVGVIALPEDRAQAGAELLVRSGAKALLNLADRPLAVPTDVVVENLSVSAGLTSLLSRSAAEPAP